METVGGTGAVAGELGPCNHGPFDYQASIQVDRGDDGNIIGYTLKMMNVVCMECKQVFYWTSDYPIVGDNGKTLHVRLSPVKGLYRESTFAGIAQSINVAIERKGDANPSGA